MTRRRSLLLALICALLLGVAACGEEEGSSGSSASGESLEGRTFISTGVTVDGAERPLVEGTTIRLEFAVDEIRANAGCNHLFGLLTSTSGGALEIEAMGGTEMGCDPERHAQDEWLVDLLTASPSWELAGDQLTITSGATVVSLLDRQVADPDRPLEGTRWVVDTIIDGEMASSIPGDGIAELTLVDGALTGSTGCNELQGNYRINDDVVHFDRFIRTDAHCGPDEMTLEEAVLALDGASATFEISASRLTLNAPDGRGLGLHAEPE